MVGSGKASRHSRGSCTIPFPQTLHLEELDFLVVVELVGVVLVADGDVVGELVLVAVEFVQRQERVAE